MRLRSSVPFALFALLVVACGSEPANPSGSGATTGGGGAAPGAGGAGGAEASSAAASVGGETSASTSGTVGSSSSASTSSGAGGAGPACPGAGKIAYTLVKAAAPTADQQAAYDLILKAMDDAVALYNCNTDIAKSLSVTYAPDVQTADGNVNGSIRFGSKESMNYITAMHEISHTVGIGSVDYDGLVKGGVFTGAAATDQMRAITGNVQDVVHADLQHFWPYGLNYTTEVMSPADLVSHCKMVVAIRKDIGF